MIRTTADVVIVGAGVIGSALARELAGAGLQVVVVERHRPGVGASGAAAGILSPQAEADGPSALLDLCLESRALFPRLLEDLRSETSIDVPYRTSGTLFIAQNDEEEARLEKRYAWQTGVGLPVERISGGRVETLEPALAAGLRIALRFPYDHQIDNVELTRALVLAAEKRGVQFRTGVEVSGLATEGNRVTGVALGPGRIYTSHVVVCAGAWSGLLDTGGPRLPIVPIRGQLVALEGAGLRLDRVIYTERGYLVPRADGRILVGSTMETAGFDATTTAGGIRTLLDLALTIVPKLEKGRITGLWAGLRPATEDGLPILGPAGPPWPEGLFFATGHFRNGILLAPLTARLLTEALTVAKTSIPLGPFLAARFARL